MKDTAKRLPPVLIGGLVVMWLMLNQTVAPAQVVLGAMLAAALARAATRLRPLQPRLERPWVAAVIVPKVLADVVRSNIGVARIVLGLVRDREVRSGFVKVPLDMHDPHGLAALAAIVTSTPGTVWVDLAEDGSRVVLHVLDLRDEAEWIRWFKGYEALLMRIFE